MNILLLDGLPEEYEGIPICADFRNMIQVDRILCDPEYSNTEKTLAALYQLYPTIPDDVEKAINGLVWFYTRGKGEIESGISARRTTNRAFDFEEDANMIYAAFYATYGLSLTTVEFLHWWEFMALFEGLPETTLIQRVIYWRTADLSELPKYERKHVEKMRRLFALKRPASKPMSVDELNQQTKQRVADRFAAARQALTEKHSELPGALLP